MNFHAPRSRNQWYPVRSAVQPPPGSRSFHQLASCRSRPPLASAGSCRENWKTRVTESCGDAAASTGVQFWRFHTSPLSFRYAGPNATCKPCTTAWTTPRITVCPLGGACLRSLDLSFGTLGVCSLERRPDGNECGAGGYIASRAEGRSTAPHHGLLLEHKGVPRYPSRGLGQGLRPPRNAASACQCQRDSRNLEALALSHHAGYRDQPCHQEAQSLRFSVTPHASVTSSAPRGTPPTGRRAQRAPASWWTPRV